MNELTAKIGGRGEIRFGLNLARGFGTVEVGKLDVHEDEVAALGLGFLELHELYAFASDDGTGNAAAAWKTVAVEPVPYPVPAGDHSRLWIDVRVWPDLAADPRQWPTARLGELLAREPHDLLPWERDQVTASTHPD